jgi:hypothetical protein
MFAEIFTTSFIHKMNRNTRSIWSYQYLLFLIFQFFKTDFLTSRSTTTSMIQSSAMLDLLRSSSRLPVDMRFAKSLWYRLVCFCNGAYQIFINHAVAHLFISSALNHWLFFVGSSRGTISSNSTFATYVALAKWQAIPLPLMPRPITVTCLIHHHIIFLASTCSLCRFS